VKAVIALLVLFTFLVGSALAEPEETFGSMWTSNTKTEDGRGYLRGFVRGYVEGKKWGLDQIEGILPYVRFETTMRIDKEQIESKLFMENLYYGRAVEEENLTKTVDQVTQWYQDPQNRKVDWSKLVDLAIGQVNGAHVNYIRHQLRWLQDVSTRKRIDWFHTIDPATGEGPVTYYDKDGKIVRTELVR